jgi:hypothetical protein
MALPRAGGAVPGTPRRLPGVTGQVLPTAQIGHCSRQAAPCRAVSRRVGRLVAGAAEGVPCRPCRLLPPSRDRSDRDALQPRGLEGRGLASVPSLGVMHRSKAAGDYAACVAVRWRPDCCWSNSWWDLSEGAVFRWPVEQVPCFFYTRLASASSS